MEGRCQCGQIRFTTPLPQPLKIYICHCTECRHQTSSLFAVSAKFPAFDIPEPEVGTIEIYQSTSESGKTKECLFCGKCGSRLIHRNQGDETVSVKAGCLEGLGELDWEAAEHIWVRSAVWKGIIPEGAKTWEMGPGKG